MAIYAHLQSPFFNIVSTDSNITKFTKNNISASAFHFVTEKVKVLWRNIYNCLNRINSRIKGRILESPSQSIPVIYVSNHQGRQVTINAQPQVSSGNSEGRLSSLASSFCSDNGLSDSGKGSLYSLTGSFSEYGLPRSGASTPTRPLRPRSRQRAALLRSGAFSS